MAEDQEHKRANVLFLLTAMAAAGLTKNAKGVADAASPSIFDADQVTAEALTWIAFTVCKLASRDIEAGVLGNFGYDTGRQLRVMIIGVVEQKIGKSFDKTEMEAYQEYAAAITAGTDLVTVFTNHIYTSVLSRPQHMFKSNPILDLKLHVAATANFVAMPKGIYDNFWDLLETYPDKFPYDHV